METLTSALIGILFIAFIVGMVKPDLFIKSPETKYKRLIIFGVWFFISMFLSVITPDIETNATAQSSIVEIDSTVVVADTISVPVVEEEKNWTYTEAKDEMTDKMTYWAMCKSEDYTEFDFPYNNSYIYLTLTCRKSPQYGTDVILTIPEGQFNAGIDGARVKVRFDEDKMTTYRASEPSDYSSTTLFIQGADGFIKRLKTAKKVLINVEFFDNLKSATDLKCLSIHN